MSISVSRARGASVENGIIAPTGALQAGTYTTMVASRCYVARFVPNRSFVATRISFHIVTASATDDAIDVGILNSSYSRLVSSGATTGKANAPTGVKTISITATPLTAGQIYYAAFAYGASGAPAQLATSTTGVAASGDLLGATAGTRMNAYKDTQATVPSSFTPDGVILATVMLGVRAS